MICGEIHEENTKRRNTDILKKRYKRKRRQLKEDRIQDSYTEDKWMEE